MTAEPGRAVEGLVSVVVPVFNRPVLLREAVESALKQTYRPLEIIIVDDGSTHETCEVADELARENPTTVRVIHQPNGGPGKAREAGRRLARGEFLQYLDSDDLLLPRKFELQVEALRARPSCGISYGKTRHYRRGADPSDVPCRRTGETMEFMFPPFLKGRIWSTVTPLFRREVTERAGPWTDLRQLEDWEYDCRIAALGVRLHYCSDFIAEQRMHGEPSLSDRWVCDVNALRDRVRAYVLIYEHASRAGLDHSVPEMQHFAREVFLMARQCGARNLRRESTLLFELARKASGPARGLGWDFRAYRCAAALIGWRWAGALTCAADRLRPR
jgi:glycosyltransferase involved in cell wall biosynthesis